jgi:16S rRNA (cytidine1402-2'-O)-methyltransferase
MVGTLYIVATPIGNLEDITLRAIRILSEVDLILAEDTRVTRKLTSHLFDNNFRPTTNLISYHHHSNQKKKLEILRYLIEGKNIALVTDAGTPGISDPGNELIDFLLEKEPNIKIVPIPGVSAITSALSISGFNVNKFLFLGFLPKKKRKKLFEWIKEGKISFAFYESPKRILKTLAVLKEEFGEDKRILIAREMTKLHETLYRGMIKNVIGEFVKSTVKGEIVVIVED